MSKDLETSSLSGTIPTSSTSPPESKKHEKTVPHYLRASTGSCHDLCKYGHKKPSEELRFSGGRRKKLHSQLNDLALHRSAILDRSKDVRNWSLSLTKSSISLSEAEHVEPKITSANRKGVASSENLVLRTASSADGKKLNSDGRKKHSLVAQKAPTNLRNSDRVLKFDRKATVPAKADTFSAKLKSSEKTTTTTKHFSPSTEKTVPEKSRSVDKVTTVRQSLLKRPSSSPTNLNSIKQVPVLSQTSSHHLHSKDKITLKGKVTSSPATVTRVRTKLGRSPTKSRNSSINGKEGLGMSRSPLSVEPKLKLTASSEAQEDNVQITGYYVESRLAELSSDATDCIDNCGPAPKDTKSASKDDGVPSTEKSELIVGEALLEGTTAIELQQLLNGQEVNTMLGECYPKHKLLEQNVVHDRTSKDEYSQTDGAVVYRLSGQLISVENADVNGTVLTENISKTEDDQLKVNASMESLVAEGKEEVGVYEDIEKSPEMGALDENHAEEPESCLDFASRDAGENVKTDEIFASGDAGQEEVRVHKGIEKSPEIVALNEKHAEEPASCLDFASRDTGENIKADEFFASGDAGQEEVGVHKDIEKSPEIVALDGKHAEEPASCLDFTSRDAGENVKADEIFDGRMNNSASHCLSISDTSSDGGLLEEPKSILSEPSDSAVNELANVSNENTFGQDGLKSGIDILQSPEELSGDEFYEEYDFELSESDEYGPEDEEPTTYTHRDESLKAGEQRPRRISTLGLDAASITPYKLKFKRGKIVDLPSDCNGPRRLKFRRKATNEVLDHVSQPARRIYKRNVRNNAVPTNPDTESPGMKLRHQDAQEKKDAQGLFNNVIEETASKLVESRKSKVKALVGAFETVISLQDGKPTSSTHAGNSQDVVHNDEGEAPVEAE